MKTLLKQLAVLRALNYGHLVIMATITFLQSRENNEYVLLSAAITIGLMVIALVINGLIIDVKTKLLK